MMNNFKKVMVIAAHPDDDVLGCGGTISKLACQGADIRVVFIAEGTTCRYQNPEYYDRKVINEKIDYRNKCGVKALKSLGVDDCVFYDLPCGRLDQEPILKIGKIIEKEITTYEPDTIFTHSKNDVNVDHQIVYQGVLQATRPGAKNNVDTVLSYEILSSSEWNFLEPFAPNFFIEISKKDVDNKVAAMSHYDTEVKPLPFPRCEDMIRMKCSTRGSQIGVKNAEAFLLVRGLMR